MDIFEEVTAFYESYRGEKRIYGYSEEGRPLYALRVGKGEPVGISQYAIHAREYVTALLALAHIRRGIRKGSVWVLPLTNPDGALLSEKGIGTVSEERRASVLRLGGNFSLWKANIEGVDLNVNFPAGWGTGAQNVFRPAPANFVGGAPLCAAESSALSAFTLAEKPRFTVSWHTKGEEIYWRYKQSPLRLMRDKKLAKVLSAATGYPLREAKDSAGGYKDWCIETLGIPAFTVETGRSAAVHPLGREELPDILQKNIDALARLTEVF